MITDQELRAITHLVVAVRKATHGASAWDEPGVMANLRKVQHQNLPYVIVSAIKSAADAKAKNPGVLASGYTPAELPPPQPRGAFPPKRHEECPNHVGQLPPPYCAVHATDDVLAWYDDEQSERASVTSRPASDPHAAADAIRAQLRNQEAS